MVEYSSNFKDCKTDYSDVTSVLDTVDDYSIIFSISSTINTIDYENAMLSFVSLTGALQTFNYSLDTSSLLNFTNLITPYNLTATIQDPNFISIKDGDKTIFNIYKYSFGHTSHSGLLSLGVVADFDYKYYNNNYIDSTSFIRGYSDLTRIIDSSGITTSDMPNVLIASNYDCIPAIAMANHVQNDSNVILISCPSVYVQNEFGNEFCRNITHYYITNIHHLYPNKVNDTDLYPINFNEKYKNNVITLSSVEDCVLSNLTPFVVAKNIPVFT